MHGWMRSGNSGTGRGVTEFLKEALALWGGRGLLRVVRADAGFFDKELLTFLEERSLPYIVVARLTKYVKREVTRIQDWRALDEHFAVGESEIQLMGWNKARRFVVVRERIQETKAPVGKKLIELPEYTFRVFVTSLAGPPEQIWRDYNSLGHGEPDRRTEARSGCGSFLSEGLSCHRCGFPERVAAVQSAQ